MKKVTRSTKTLRKSIGVSADRARLWFESRTQLKSREQFKTKGGLDDTRRGAVYAYFQRDGHALYISPEGGGVRLVFTLQLRPTRERDGGLSGQLCASFNSKTKWTDSFSNCI